MKRLDHGSDFTVLENQASLLACSLEGDIDIVSAPQLRVQFEQLLDGTNAYATTERRYRRYRRSSLRD